ncbi:uncharacterized protein GGS22DRAFT_163426 [Annulohypoxylon maeteangense]|uniref:uncharacterized protein n=1 Tax=Annulohypoxylon maeteangense TaxID=1927788 RepID=UPI002007BFBA|nr:uncharacterized protein GGS22DRAFT_163426 [Annulohypoxylon maeteangense]KAI0885321.1 hypothetical protein GGS22DRAFT_163426 [Annulohypoxylon maeteangense]
MSLAPAISKDGFSYAGDLFAEASGLNRHRRATVTELKDHFKSGSDKDHPAHWFEAQCIHYGLQSSKTKAVARMRLFDAVNGGKLAVPSHIKKLESELKKEWTKNEREAKKALKDTSTPTTKSTKRKAGADTVDLTLNVGGINITVSANSSAKKTKTTTAKAAPASSKKKATSAAPSSSASAPSTPTARGRAPRGRGALHQGPGRNSVPAPSPSPVAPRPIQTAHSSQGRARDVEYNGNTDINNPKRSGKYGSSVVKDEDEDEDQDRDELKPLGLLNGRYVVVSSNESILLKEGLDESFIVLTLSGSQLWGSFNFPIMHGIIRLQTRPYQSSRDALKFNWRGREEAPGKITFGNGHGGWIKFLGDGMIEVYIDDYGILFTAKRVADQGTRSEIDAATMKAEYNSYTYELFDAENSYKFPKAVYGGYRG